MVLFFEQGFVVCGEGALLKGGEGREKGADAKYRR